MQNIRERVLQAGLEEPPKDSYISVYIHEVAAMLPYRLDRQPYRLL